jgi:hypothetical protein
MRRSAHLHQRKARHGSFHRDDDSAPDLDRPGGQRGDYWPGCSRYPIVEEEVGRGVELAVEVVGRAAAAETSAAAEDCSIGQEDSYKVISARVLLGAILENL